MHTRELVKKLGFAFVKLSDWGKDRSVLDLAGDRFIEWAWVAAHVPDHPGTVLDFGCGDAFLGLTAAIRGANAVGFDRLPLNLPYAPEHLQIQTGDILDFDFGGAEFDIIINCSSIEHVGLGGRYGSSESPDGDLIAMRKLRRLLKKPHGIMLLTLPVGKDAVFRPLHRVYGNQRLPALLEGFSIRKKEFWSKRPGRNVWIQVHEEEALATRPSESFYGLGCFVLTTGV
ncbi:MAG: DUF268 domain-containing protein [Chloroflexi bacterium]|nr:DUF268 domain-containing protein [Chloroflexota bacterium]